MGTLAECAFAVWHSEVMRCIASRDLDAWPRAALSRRLAFELQF